MVSNSDLANNEQHDGNGWNVVDEPSAVVAPDQRNSRQSLGLDILLLSWMIVLLRVQDDGQVCFEWSLQSANETSAASILCFGSSDIIPSLDVSITDAKARISGYFPTIRLANTSSEGDCIDLVVSTRLLSKVPKQYGEEDVLHLNISLCGQEFQVQPHWHSAHIPPQAVSRYVNSFITTAALCTSTLTGSIADLLKPISCDLDEIWSWNHEIPPSYDFCMSEMVSEWAMRNPHKVAVDGWDGTLTYEVIDHCSTEVAHMLRESGTQPHDVVPICFEKSRWTVVAVLAVMKSGATFVLMDPTLPLARLQEMARQTGATRMLTSRLQYELSKTVIPAEGPIVVEEAAFSSLSSAEVKTTLHIVPASTLMYIIFTSGSTGLPKGVKISHSTYTSSAVPRAKAVGYTEHSRVLDFASYAFDVSIDSMLLTLGNGGCLCIPSDEDRMNDINGAMRKMKVNYAGLTPSVGRILDADVISSLEGLGLGGEAVSARDVTNWGKDARIIIGYGPCECTIGCTVNGSAATGRDYISIGPGNGAVMWIVHPDDHNSLMPVGAVGELLVEGPIVGQGYLNDPDKTAAAFIEDPTWLLAGHGSYNGRHARLYKTGDLGKYDPDGSGGIVFVGRKDTQVKLRGQRVELGEIESQLKARLPSDTTVVAEVLPSGAQPILVAFVASKPASGESTDLAPVELPKDLCDALAAASLGLAEVLPRYMIPAAFIPVNFIPALISGKTDRRKLKQFGASVDIRKLDTVSNNTPNPPLSDVELCLRQAWSQVLKCDAVSIRLDDNFFTSGGDSVMAMRLVSVCRAHGLSLNVAKIFEHGTLSSMAEVTVQCESSSRLETSAFSMISQKVDQACSEAANACGVELDAIEDIYPCTPTQESLFTFSLKSTVPYVAQRIARIPADMSVDALKKAWESTIANSQILRTRVAQLSESGLQQVVLKQGIHWLHATDLDAYLSNDAHERMDLGRCLARYAIIDNSRDCERYMVWTVHHVLYDGWSEQLILRKVQQALEGQQLETDASIKDFVKFLRGTSGAVTRHFWTQELEGAIGPQFPRLPSRDYLPTLDGFLERQIQFRSGSGSPFTIATYIRGAWALVASQYTNSDDVVFGETLIGRDVALPAVESIIGPLIATLPVRVRINRTTSVRSYLQSIQQSMSARTPHQHMGMQNIRNVSVDAQHACEAPTGLVIQLEPEYTGDELGFQQGDVVQEALHFNPYPLMLACGIQEGGFRVCASFDTALVAVKQMNLVLAQFEVACTQLASGLDTATGEIGCISAAELDHIWKWNQAAPLDLEGSGDLRASAQVKQGSLYPPATVSWVCDPRNSSILSPIGCVGELYLESNKFSAAAITTPSWLKAGSASYSGRKGKVQPTGDLVRQSHDGNITFVRRKDQTTQVNGHSVDIDELETHFRRHLTSNSRIAATTQSCSSPSSGDGSMQNLVVFVEQTVGTGPLISLLTEDHHLSIVTSQGNTSKVIVLGMVSSSLVASLKKLDKFARDSLPSYMVPSAYVVVDKVPTEDDKIERDALACLALDLPPTLLMQLHENLRTQWIRVSTNASLAASESILRASWAKLLGLDDHEIDTDDNFFRLGGDSVLAMRLVSNLRMQGHELTVADIFRHMRLEDAAKVLKLDLIAAETKPAYRPFSTVRPLGLDSFIAEVVRPQLADSDWPVKDVLMATDSQAHDIQATVNAPRTSVQYTNLYLEGAIDRVRLTRACNDLVKTHDILRTTFVEHDSKFYQVVLEELDTGTLERTDVDDLEAYVKNICESDANFEINLGTRWVSIWLTWDQDGRTCLSIRLSHAQYDGVSLPRMLENLSSLYSGTPLPPSEPFSTYIAQINDSSAVAKAQKYWRDLLNGSSLSTIGMSSSKNTDKSTFQTKRVDTALCSSDITTANLLTAAWALVLARRLRTTDVTFGNVTSGRGIGIANAQDILGPCYQFTPVRVVFRSAWTALDLLRFIQRQTADSAPHDFLGFEKIARQCTQWPTNAKSFDSLVHHQDVIEETETLPFGDGSCRVEVLKPHGDAAYPLKVVSYIRNCTTHVGVVGSENDCGVVSDLLSELAATVEELAACRHKQLSLGCSGSLT